MLHHTRVIHVEGNMILLQFDFSHKYNKIIACVIVFLKVIKQTVKIVIYNLAQCIIQQEANKMRLSINNALQPPNSNICM